MAEKEEADRANLLELQDKMIMVHDASRRVANQERQRARHKYMQELTVTELKSLPEDVACYKSVGKAYFLTTKAEAVAEHEASIAEDVKELESLKQNRAAVDQKLKETEDELGELVASSPHLVRLLANFKPT